MHRRFLLMLFCVACALPGLAAAQPDPGKPAVKADLSAYDCSSVGISQSGRVIHFGQVIQATYFEWYQYHQNAAGGDKLVCVSLIKPSAKMLSRDEAQEFIGNSANVGAPTLDQQKQEKTAQAPVDAGSVDIPPPAPLPRAIYPERSQSGSGDLPAVSPQAQFPAQMRNPNLVDGQTANGQIMGGQSGDIPPAPGAAPKADTTPANSGGARVEKPQTLGVDDRTKVTPSNYPYNTIGYLVITYSDNASFSCTGTLVSAYVVLTAGHCIHNSNNHGGWAKSITFYPAQDQVTSGALPIRPYGGKSDWTWERTTSSWTAISGPESHPISDYAGDYAAIEFATPVTYTSTFMPVVFNDTDGVNNAGYPNSVSNVSNNLAMWSGFGSEDSTSISVYRNIHLREFLINSSPGDSGGPFWSFYSSTNQRAFSGTLSYGDPLNDQAGGPWYDGWNQSLVTAWITWTPASDKQTAVTPSVAGLRVPGIFGTAQQGSQSLVRLFNPTSQSGTVQITVADYATGQPLATWTSPSIPALAELQFSIGTIEANASTSFAPQSFYSFSVRPTFDGYFQHVLWKPSDGSLSNLTMCDAKVTSNPNLLFGVHSSVLQAGYPSTVVVHNTDLNATTVTLGIYDAATGAKLATFTTPSIPGNGQYIQAMSNIEKAASPSIKPTATMFHYIIKSESSFHGELQHIMVNSSSGVITDLTTYCAMTPAPS